MSKGGRLQPIACRDIFVPPDDMLVGLAYTAKSYKQREFSVLLSTTRKLDAKVPRQLSPDVADADFEASPRKS